MSVRVREPRSLSAPYRPLQLRFDPIILETRTEHMLYDDDIESRLQCVFFFSIRLPPWYGGHK